MCYDEVTRYYIYYLFFTLSLLIHLWFQVVIGGRNKYLINGSNATPSRVQDLFRSVQLNVNNPHFLIMQGRVTKVLNMKPPEVHVHRYMYTCTVHILYIPDKSLEGKLRAVL